MTKLLEEQDNPTCMSEEPLFGELDILLSEELNIPQSINPLLKDLDIPLSKERVSFV